MAVRTNAPAFVPGRRLCWRTPAADRPDGVHVIYHLAQHEAHVGCRGTAPAARAGGAPRTPPGRHRDKKIRQRLA